MRYADTLQLFDQAFDFPIDRDSVIRQLGTVELTAPSGDVVTVKDILDRTDEPSYQSPDDLYTSLIGNLEDGFIGRKYYDDRGGVESGVKDDRIEDVSF